MGDTAYTADTGDTADTVDTDEIYLDDLIKTNRVVYTNLLRICTLLDLIRSNKYYNSEEYQAIKKQQGGTDAEKLVQNISALTESFKNGEIDNEQYQEKLSQLKNNPFYYL